MKKSKLGSVLLALSLAAQMAIPMAMAADTTDVYSNGGEAESKVLLTVSDTDCTHEGAELKYTTNGDGTHNGVCPDCGTLVVNHDTHSDADNDGTCDDCGADVKSEHTHTVIDYRDNKDGTHSEYCMDCGDAVSNREAHIDENDDLICDKCYSKLDAPDPILIATVPLQLPVIMDGEGNITVSETAAIQNVQSRMIAVSAIDVSVGEGWELFPMGGEFPVEEAGTSVFSLSFRGVDMSPLYVDIANDWYVGGVPSDQWVIGGETALPLEMAVEMPQQPEAVQGVKLASVSFTLQWAD